MACGFHHMPMSLVLKPPPSAQYCSLRNTWTLSLVVELQKGSGQLIGAPMNCDHTFSSSVSEFCIRFGSVAPSAGS